LTKMVEAVRENNDLFHLPRSCKARIRSGNKEVRLPCPGRRYLKFRRITLSVIFSLLSVLAGLGPIFPSIIQAASHASADSATASPSLTRQGFNTATPDGPGVSLQPGTVKSGSRARPSFTQVSDNSISPHLISTGQAYTFQTSFGDYSFNKSTPYVFSLRSRSGTPLTRGSMFFVNSSASLLPGATNVTMLADNGLVVNYSLMAGSRIVGVLTLTVSFTTSTRPKFTASLAQTPSWTYGDFNILWMTVPAQRWLSPTGQSPALDMQGQTSTISAGLSIDVGPYPDRSSWREWLTTDWKDAGGGTVQVSQATMGSVNGKAFTIMFPTNRAKIDPTQVGSTTDWMGATGWPTQRKTFSYGGYYFLFWHDGSNIVYSSSNNGVSWSPPYSTGSGISSSWGFSLATLGSTVGLAWYQYDPVLGKVVFLLSEKGTIIGGSIAWTGVNAPIATYYSIPDPSRPLSMTISQNGTFWVAGVWQDSSANYRDWIYYSNDGSSFHPSLNYTVSCPTNPQETIVLTPLFRGNIMALSSGPCDTSVHWRTWNSIGWSWSPPQNVTLGTNDGLYSATTSPDGSVHLAYSVAFNQIKWADYDNSTSQWTLGGTIYNGSSGYPTISSDALGNLYAFWFPGYPYFPLTYPMYSWKAKANGPGQGWSTPVQPFGSSSVPAAWGLTAVAVASKEVFAAWTVDPCSTCQTYQIVFGSIPLSSGAASAPPSQPWNRLGIPSSAGAGEYVAPGNGLLAISQTDLSVPGRNGLTLSIGRIYIQPFSFLQGTPFNFETNPYNDLGNDWQLNLPWVGSVYLHLFNGQTFPLLWTSVNVTGSTTISSLDNHSGEDFVLTKTSSPTGTSYRMYHMEGSIYSLLSTAQVATMTDNSGQNRLGFGYSNNILGWMTATR